MNDILTLIKPRLLSAKNNGFSKNKKGGWKKIAVLGSVGTLFWAGVFFVSLRVLYYFKSIEQLGDILAFKLLSMLTITIFSLIIFSSIITSLSKLYLSKDLRLVTSTPVASYKIFIARWFESTIDSSWMVVVYSLPILISYGIVFKTGVFYYTTAGLSVLFLLVSGCAISVVLVMLAVVIVPASRIRGIFVFVGLMLFIGLYLAFRILKPERLVDPEVFATTLMYIKSLKTPSSPYLPSTWAFDGMKAALSGEFLQGIFHLSILFFFTAAMICLCVMIANAIYFKGISKTQAARMKFLKQRGLTNKLVFFLPGPTRAFFVKEIKNFLRDQTQWSQLFLLGALIIIYVYNFSVLPIEKSPIPTFYLENILSFLNMGLALFVLTAITARFAYPAVSIEGEAFWLVRSSPISKKTYLWIKFFIYFVPLLVLTEILIVATNILLNVTTFMMILSTVTVFFMVPGIVSLGVGLGAAFPDFKSENPVQAVSSFGGFVFMVLCAAFIGMVIALEAGPVYNLFMADIKKQPLGTLEWIWVYGSFLIAFALSVSVIVLPMRFGEKKLSGK
jgi:ABC-2 type transport system permease protein